MAIETDGKTTATHVDGYETKDGFLASNPAAAAIRRAEAALKATRSVAEGAGQIGMAWFDRVARATGPYLTPAARFMGSLLISRIISKTLLRRIIASNLLGLFILMAGLTYLIQFNSWLIDAKIEHLRAQSHILAAAIASKASFSAQQSDRDDTQGTYDPLRDDPFAAIEFSIEPEIVVPLLPKLLEKTTERGRVYDVSGVLIADSAEILRPGSIIPIRPGGRIEEKKPKTKNIFTRITQWLMSDDLRVYKEIRTANGRFYPEVKAALKGETTAMMMLAKNREKIVSVATPIIRGDQIRGVLLLSTAPGAIDDVQANELFAALVLVLVAAAASLLASFLLARTVAEPVRQLSQYANEVTHDIKAAKELPKFDERADEVGQLARSFALMTRALYRRIEASEKFAADVAHELKNPLTAARSTAESLVYVKSDQQRDEFIEQIQLELKRLNKLISDVSDASRLDADLALQRFQPVDLSDVVDSLAATFRDLPAGRGRTIDVNIEPTGARPAYVIAGQNGRIEQVLTNLLANALSFTPEGGTVTIKLRRRPRAIELMVEDDGPGIDPENLERIFARFYTYRPTKNTSRGDNSGLGLAISREIVEAHNGEVWAENIWPSGSQKPAHGEERKPLGARFVVRLPVATHSEHTKTGRLSGGR